MGWQAIYAAFAQIGTTIINSGGIFVYNGAPGLGNLLVAITNFTGTDSFGNTVVEGLNVDVGVISGTSISGGTITGTTISGATVTGTTISGGTITGTTFNGTDFILNTNGLWMYSGTPGPSNPPVIALINPSGTATDPFGNSAPFGYSSQYPIYLGPYSNTPTSIPNISILYSMGGGFQYVDGFDAQTYQTGRRTLWKSSSQLINTTGPSAFHQTTLSGGPGGGNGRSYLIEGRAYFVPNQTAGQFGMQWNGSGFSPNPSGLIGFIWATGATFNAVNPVSINTTSNPGFTMQNGLIYQIVYGGVITCAAGTSGTLSISGVCSAVADTFNVASGSYVNIGPI